jgi:hypothetical protein
MLFALLSAVHARTWVVDPGGGGDFTNLAAAMNAVADGDTLELVAGTHGGTGPNLLRGIEVTLIGAGSSSTLVEVPLGGMQGAALHLQDLEYTAEGPRVWDGELSLDDVVLSGDSGVQLVDSRAEVTDCSFSGEYGLKFSPAIEDVALEGLTFSGLRGAAVVFDGDWAWSLSISGSSFEDLPYTAVLAWDLEALTVQDSRFVRGSGPREGGAVNVTGQGAVTVDGCTFEDNEASDEGGAVFANTLGDVAVSDSVFTGNVAGGPGGALYLMGAVIEVVDSSFTSNSAPQGGAVAGSFDGDDTLARLAFVDNLASEEGGAIYGVDTVQDSLFVGNSASEHGGALMSAGAVERCDFVDNHAGEFGGALRDVDQVDDGWFQGNSATWGGAIHNRSGHSLTASDSTFLDNLATSGSGGAVLVNGDGGTDTSSGSSSGSVDMSVVIARGWFEDNQACDEGGGLWIDQVGEVRITDSRFVGNTADTCGGGGDGGAVWARPLDRGDVAVSLTRVGFCGNSADSGGGLYLKNGTSELLNLAFVENVATGGKGGGAWLRNVQGELTQSAFLGNEAVSGGGLYGQISGLDVSNGLFAWTVGGDGLAFDADTASDSSVSTSDFWSNSAQDVASGSGVDTAGDGNLTVDPALESYSQDGDCSNDALWLSSGSPLLGAGTDTDGSSTDIGLHGGAEAWSSDEDGDGYDYDEDCNDLDPDTSPGADEVCGRGDEDCDGEVDESSALDAVVYYPDLDGDGFGDEASALASCEELEDHLTEGGDCDDGAGEVSPAALEICDGVDNDCDGETDPDGAEGSVLFYVDQDQDGVGGDELLAACALREGLSEVTGDCDDLDAQRSPQQEEIPYDGVDNDCDGQDLCDVDEDGVDHPDCGGTDCDDEDGGRTEDCGDSAVPEDTDPPPEVDEDPSETRSCSMAGPGGRPVWSLALLALVGLRRRPRSRQEELRSGGPRPARPPRPPPHQRDGGSPAPRRPAR